MSRFGSHGAYPRVPYLGVDQGGAMISISSRTFCNKASGETPSRSAYVHTSNVMGWMFKMGAKASSLSIVGE